MLNAESTGAIAVFFYLKFLKIILGYGFNEII